jgi:hypothetical protein
MYWNDHQPPHFHACYAENEVVIRLETLEVAAGSLPRRAMGLLLEWAGEHRAELWENWKRVHSQQPILPIAPLE